MAGVGCGFSIAATAFAALGLLPLLGWLNWFTTLPAAALAMLLSLIALVTGQQPGTAALGLAVGTVVLCWAIFRLFLGGGLL